MEIYTLIVLFYENIKNKIKKCLLFYLFGSSCDTIFITKFKLDMVIQNWNGNNGLTTF